MKVLQVSCGGLGKGGVQNVIMNICRNMPQVHFDIIVFTDQRRYYDREFELLGGKIYRIPNYEGLSKIRCKIDYYIRFFRIFWKTYKLIKQDGPYDVIHCHNDFESGICNLAAYFAGVKIRISHAHTANNKLSRMNILGYIYKKALQKLMNLTTNVKVGCTEKAFTSVFGDRYLAKNNSYIIHNPIDLSKYEKIYHEKGDKVCDINIVHVGRYEENKNQIFIVEVLPYILKEYPSARLWLIGSGEKYKEILKEKVKTLRIESNVEFLQAESNIKEILDNASLFIFPSISEGFGIVLLEAQAMEVPCLVSDSVPREADCGLCEFLSLNDKKEIWADKAINIIKGNHDLKLDRNKLKGLDIKKYIDKIGQIYLSEILLK